MSRLLAAVAATGAALALAAPSLAGASPAEAGCPPAPPAASASAPSQPARAARVRAPAAALVACVGVTRIAGSTFDHWAFIAERSAGHAWLKRHTVVTQVMDFLISSEWTLGEAAALGVSFTEAQVRARFDAIKHQGFPHPREFRRFLRGSGQTVPDLLFRVRVSMTSQALQRKVLSSAHSKKESLQLLTEFIRAFKARWQSETYCETGFAVGDCGHVGTL